MNADLPEIPNDLPDIPKMFPVPELDYWPHQSELDKFRSTVAALQTELKFRTDEVARLRKELHSARLSGCDARVAVGKLCEQLTRIHTLVSNATRRVGAGQIDTATDLLQVALREMWGRTEDDELDHEDSGYRLNVCIVGAAPIEVVTVLGETVYVRVHERAGGHIVTEVAIPAADLYRLFLRARVNSPANG